MASGQVWLGIEAPAGLGRYAQTGRSPCRQEHRAPDKPLVLQRGPSSRSDRRRAPAIAGFGGLAARDAEEILQPVRKGHSRPGLPRPALRLALASPGHAPALLQSTVGRARGLY